MRKWSEDWWSEIPDPVVKDVKIGSCYISWLLWAPSQQRKVLFFHRKEGTRVPSLNYRDFGVYSMNKKWSWLTLSVNHAGKCGMLLCYQHVSTFTSSVFLWNPSITTGHGPGLAQDNEKIKNLDYGADNALLKKGSCSKDMHCFPHFVTKRYIS